MKRVAKELIQGAVDLLFPPYCQVCGARGEPFCARCQQDRVAAGLRSDVPYLDGVISAGLHEGPLRRAVLALKFAGRITLVESLAAVLERELREWQPDWQVDALVPVPIHWLRRLARGFNQSELLAAALGRAVGLRVLDRVLSRVRGGRPQIGLTAGDRLRNVRGAFAVSGSLPAAEPRLLLLDDVCTTGATLSECARVLREAGAKAVWGITLTTERIGEEQADQSG